MKNLNRSLIQKFKKIREKPGVFLFIAALFLILGTYIFSKHQDTKIITYENQAQNFEAGRVISRNNEIYKRKDKIYTDKVESLESKLEDLAKQLANYEQSLAKEDLNQEAIEKEGESNIPTSSRQEHLPPLSSPQFQKPPRDFASSIVQTGPEVQDLSNPDIKRRKHITKNKTGPATISFPVKSNSKEENHTVQIPSGSFVKARLLTGIEAPEGKALPVLLQADYAFIGPNKSKVDLSGCFLIAKSTGNLSIERVEMQATKISCVSRSGKAFERKLSGFVADGKDNSFAVMGEVNSKQDRVASMAFLSSVVDGIGKAISQAQTSSVTSQNGGSSTSITGSEGRYVAANGASNAATTITNWYLKHAERLLPTINIGSGQEAWIVVQEPVSLPNWYFKKPQNKQGGMSFLSKILN
ncbi:MAG: TraB/VirB10 family protein [Oligoflexales bacterium]